MNNRRSNRFSVDAMLHLLLLILSIASTTNGFAVLHTTALTSTTLATRATSKKNSLIMTTTKTSLLSITSTICAYRSTSSSSSWMQAVQYDNDFVLSTFPCFEKEEEHDEKRSHLKGDGETFVMGNKQFGSSTQAQEQQQQQHHHQQQQQQQEIITPPSLTKEDVKKGQELLETMKPAYWWPSVLPLLCGAVASGHFHDFDVSTFLYTDLMYALGAIALVGPCWEGFAETLNELFLDSDDTSKDASNNGESTAVRLSETNIWTKLALLSMSAIGLPLGLETLITSSSPNHAVLQLSLMFSALSIVYAAPPFQLAKKGGWIGDWTAAVASTSLPWLMGYSLFATADHQSFAAILFPMLYSLVGLGPAIIRDFELTQKDSGIRLRSLFSMEESEKRRTRTTRDNRSRWAAVGLQDSMQLGISLYIWSVLGETVPAAIIAAMVFPQMFVQRSLLFSRLVDSQKAFAFNQPFVLVGLMAASYAIGQT